MLTHSAPLLHLDWIQMQVKWFKSDETTFHPMYKVKKLEYGTRHFKCIQEVYILNKRIVTLASKPASNILDPHAMIAKFDNWVCYTVNMKKIITDFLTLNALEFISFSRIDFCADFNKFDNGMHPSKFIKHYIYRRMLRTGKSKNVAHHFGQGKDEHIEKGLKWGSNLSEVTAYIYDKTLEMETVKWKPHIYKSWIDGGLNVKEHVWRIELSMKSGGTLLVNSDTSEVDIMCSLKVLDYEYIYQCFYTLCRKYFAFKWNDGTVRRDRMSDVKLFKGIQGIHVLVHADKMLDADRSKKIFIKKLFEVNNELRGTDFNLCIYGDLLLRTLIDKCHLQTWAIKQGLN